MNSHGFWGGILGGTPAWLAGIEMPRAPGRKNPHRGYTKPGTQPGPRNTRGLASRFRAVKALASLRRVARRA